MVDLNKLSTISRSASYTRFSPFRGAVVVMTIMFLTIVPMIFFNYSSREVNVVSVPLPTKLGCVNYAENIQICDSTVYNKILGLKFNVRQRVVAQFDNGLNRCFRWNERMRTTIPFCVWETKIFRGSSCSCTAFHIKNCFSRRCFS